MKNRFESLREVVTCAMGFSEGEHTMGNRSANQRTCTRRYDSAQKTWMGYADTL